MDKKFFIAILLSILIIIVYSSPQYQKHFGKSVPVELETSTQAQTSDEKAPAKRTLSKPAPAISTKSSILANTEQPEATVETQSTENYQINIPDSRDDVTIENDVVRIILSPEGGTIKHVFFNEYNGSEDNTPAQIVNDENVWYDGTVTDGDFELPLTALVFSVRKHSDSKAVLSAELNDGRTITREFALNESAGFLLNAKTDLDGPWDSPTLSFAWHGAINDTEIPYKALRIWPFSMMMRDDRMIYQKMVYLGEGVRSSVVNGKSKNGEKRVFLGDHAQKIDAKKEGSGEDMFSGDLQWYAVRNKYFISIVIPHETARWDAQSYYQYSAGEKNFEFAVSKKLTDGSTDMDIYVGPMSYGILKSYNRSLTESMELSFRFIRPLSIFFLKIIKILYRFVPNWGLVIILFALMIKMVLYPLTKNMHTSMKKMSSLQPQIAELKEKNKNNPQQVQKETMELYKREGVNPFGGCLPMLLQMPVFFALYPVVGRAFELRQAMFIPYWIEDLSRPDPYFILPVAFGISMFFQSKQTMKDPNQKAMLYIMPFMMVILFANFSAGLTLYWFLFNVMTSLQQKFQKTI